MAEAERLCDSLAIIDHGKLIASGTVAELRSQLGARDVLQLAGHFPDNRAGAALLQLAASGIDDLEIISEEADVLTVSLSDGSQHLPAIFEKLSAAGATVTETNLRRPNLETLFLLLTGKELRE